jgi:hypothetical protein
MRIVYSFLCVVFLHDLWTPTIGIGKPVPILTIVEGEQFAVRGSKLTAGKLEILGSHPQGGIVVVVGGRHPSSGADTWLLVHCNRGTTSLIAEWNSDSPSGDGILWNVRRVDASRNVCINANGHVLCSFDVREGSSRTEMAILCVWDGQRLRNVGKPQRLLGNDSWMEAVLLNTGSVITTTKNALTSYLPVDNQPSILVDTEGDYDLYHVATDGRYVIAPVRTGILLYDGHKPVESPTLVEHKLAVGDGWECVGTSGHFACYGNSRFVRLVAIDAATRAVTELIARDAKIEESNAWLRHITHVAVGPSGTVSAVATISPRENPVERLSVVLRWQDGKVTEIMPRFGGNDSYEYVVAAPDDSVIGFSRGTVPATLFRIVRGEAKSVYVEKTPIRGFARPHLEIPNLDLGGLRYIEVGEAARKTGVWRWIRDERVGTMEFGAK